MDNGWHFNSSWFCDAARLKLGTGSEVAFWKYAWLGALPLKDLYPRLFKVASIKDISVEGSGLWNGNCWVWQWS